METTLLAPVSAGELADKITVLKIKSEHISDAQKKSNIDKELALLMNVFTEAVSQTPEITDALARLKAVNLEIWDLSDKIHECERKNIYTEDDIVFYRVIHTKNDMRFSIKKEINTLAKSGIVEEKSYEGQ